MNTVKSMAKQFKREYKVPRKLTSMYLESVLDKMGALIVEYSQYINEPDVESLLRSIHKLDIAKTVDSFYHIDKSKKIVFIKEGLNEKDKIMLLLHEIGHIYCDNTIIRNAVQNTGPQKEKAANEFMNYILKSKSSHKTIIITAIVISISLIVLSFYHYNNILQQTVYVTQYGNKYHRIDCSYIQGHEVREITLYEAKKLNLDPCKICKPFQLIRH